MKFRYVIGSMDDFENLAALKAAFNESLSASEEDSSNRKFSVYEIDGKKVLGAWNALLCCRGMAFEDNWSVDGTISFFQDDWSSDETLSPSEVVDA